jgi:hypothetical protein
MDATTIAIQQARVAAVLTLAVQAISLFMALEDNDGAKRQKTNFQQHMHWDAFVQNNKDQPLFRCHLRMSYDSFCTLLDLIRFHLTTIDGEMAALRGGAIIYELYLYATIRFLAGASYTDICFFCGISKLAFYCILWRTICAINLAIPVNFPTSPEDCAMAAADFENISYHRVISNCVGAIDGYLLAIVTPPKRHARNVRSYFSGHYQRYGVNIQACCDAHCRFTFLGIGGPGVTKDCTAIKDCGLYDLVENLPPGYICIADCAYQPTENLVPIFGGDLALKKENDNFNFFASQLRIRIEMAFGLMTRKWGILQRLLSVGLPSIKHLINEQLKGGIIPVAQAALNTVATLTSLSFPQVAYMNAAAQVRQGLLILLIFDIYYLFTH